MSSDNYYLVWKKNEQYHVGMFFMSDFEDDPSLGEAEWSRELSEGESEAVFPRLEDALKYASENYTEYGVSVDPSVYA
jgi:hypothetical protein